MTSLPADRVLDQFFLEVRSKLLETAAIFDRLGRGEGSDAVAADPRGEVAAGGRSADGRRPEQGGIASATVLVALRPELEAAGTAILNRFAPGITTALRAAVFPVFSRSWGFLRDALRLTMSGTGGIFAASSTRGYGVVLPCRLHWAAPRAESGFVPATSLRVRR